MSTLRERKSLRKDVRRRTTEPRYVWNKRIASALLEVSEAWVRRYKLSVSEEVVFMLSVRYGTANTKRLGSPLRVTTNTVKAHVRSILRRTGAPTLTRVVLCVYSETLDLALSRQLDRKEGLPCPE